MAIQMLLYQLGKLTVSICVNLSLQKKEAERPKVEVVQEEEEVVIHEDNEWGEQLTIFPAFFFFVNTVYHLLCINTHNCAVQVLN